MVSLIFVGLVVYGLSRAAKYFKNNPDKAKQLGDTLRSMSGKQP